MQNFIQTRYPINPLDRGLNILERLAQTVKDVAYKISQTLGFYKEVEHG